MYRILVVDDEENIREVIKEYAESRVIRYPRRAWNAGYRDGEEQRLRHHHNGRNVPRLDGYSACKEIRKIKRSRYLCCPPAARSTTSCSV